MTDVHHAGILVKVTNVKGRREVRNRVDKGQLVRPTDAAIWLGVSKQRVNELLRAGRLRRIRKLGRTYVDGQDVLEYAQRRRERRAAFEMMAKEASLFVAERSSQV